MKFLMLALGLSLALATPGCAELQTIGNYCKQPQNVASPLCKAEPIAIDCGTPLMKSTVKLLLADVMAAIQGQTVDWGALGKLELTYGLAAVTCAVQEADALATTPTTPNPQTFTAELGGDLHQLAVMHKDTIHSNAQSYYKARNVAVK